MKTVDLTGQRFGRLTVVSRASNRGAKTCWHCRCDCGFVPAVKTSHLTSGKTGSCGCLREELRSTHGHTRTGWTSPTYNSWSTMIQRCTNARATGFSDYGGRGIGVCARWNSFEHFLADMGERPADKSLDRIDNYGNYEPNNCRWATQSEQNLNRRPSEPKKLCKRGHSLSDGKRRCVLCARARTRIALGWPKEVAYMLAATDCRFKNQAGSVL